MELCVYHQPVAEIPFGHTWAVKMDSLAKDGGRLPDGLCTCAYFRSLTCATMAAYDAPQ